MSIFSSLGAIEQILSAQTKEQDPMLLPAEKSFPICGTPSPYDSSNVENRKIGKCLFLNPIYGDQRTSQPNCFLLSCNLGIKYLYLQFKFLAQRGQTHCEGSNKAQKLAKKSGQ